jgi:putative PIN family toxin of toxin-antitoxin system
MLRAVLDTNVIVSGTISNHGTPFQVLEGWRRGEFATIVSEPILQEIERVFHYPRIKDRRHLTDQDIDNILQLLRRYGLNTPAEIRIEAIIEDPGDEKFVVAAIEGGADYIVSGDRHLKALNSYRQIRIVSPSEFVQILRSSGV